MKDVFIQKLAKKSKLSEIFIGNLWESISEELIKEGKDISSISFNVSLVNRIKKKLKINESSIVILRFKEFLKESNETKTV